MFFVLVLISLAFGVLGFFSMMAVRKEVSLFSQALSKSATTALTLCFVLALSMNPATPAILAILLFVAFALATAADFMLHYWKAPDIRNTVGVGVFALVQVSFILYSLFFGLRPSSGLVILSLSIIIIAGVFLFLTTNRIKDAFTKAGSAAYYGILVLSTCMAILTGNAFLAVGLILYLLSDTTIYLHEFWDVPWLRDEFTNYVVDMSSYWSALLIISWSLCTKVV